MPQVSIKVSGALEKDLSALCGLGNDKLDKIARSLSESARSIIKPAELRAALAAAGEGEAAQIVERVVLGLSSLRRQGHLTVDEVIESLEQAIKSLNWDESLLVSWASSRHTLKNILKESSINATAKAVDLLYDHDHFFVGAKILTNVRPIFDEQRETVLGAAINQILRLEYSNGKSERTNVSLAVDEDDLKWLRDACVDALVKGKTLEREVAEKWNIPSLTIDELNNDKS